MDQEQMQAWMKYANPAEHHEFLNKLAGKWHATVTFWMQPGADPMQSEGTAENEMILGGRFLQCKFTGNMMGQPFHGMSIDGYDNHSKKYQGIWMDTMGTIMLVFEGTVDADGRVRTMMTEFLDPMTNAMKKMKGVTTIEDENRHRYEGWNSGPDGNLVRAMEIVYTR